MGVYRKSSLFLRECIEESLFELLKTHNYESIDIKELCEKAGVGRTSFYRYFRDKETVVRAYLTRLWRNWCARRGIDSELKMDRDTVRNILSFSRENGEVLTLLYRNDMDWVILKAFRQGRQETGPTMYINYFMTSGLLAVLKEWVAKGFKESPEYIIGNLLNSAKSFLQSAESRGQFSQ